MSTARWFIVLGCGAAGVALVVVRPPAEAGAQTLATRPDASAQATVTFTGIVLDNEKATPLGGVTVQLLAGTQPETKTLHTGDFSLAYTGEVHADLRIRFSRDGFQSVILPIALPASPTAPAPTFRMMALDPIDEAVQAAAAATDCSAGMPRIEQIGSTALDRKGPHLSRAIAALTTISSGGGVYSELERTVAARCLDRVRLDAPQKNCTGLGHSLLAELAKDRAQLAVGRPAEEQELLEVASVLRCHRRTKYLVIEKCEPECPKGTASSPSLGPGDVIVRVGGSPVQSLDEWNAIVASPAKARSVPIEIRRNDGNGSRITEVPSSEMNRLVCRPAGLRDLKFLRKQTP